MHNPHLGLVNFLELQPVPNEIKNNLIQNEIKLKITKI